MNNCLFCEQSKENQIKEPWEMTRVELATKYQKAGDIVDGHEVRSEIPNMDSIEASIDYPIILPGIYEIPLSEFNLTGQHYSASGTRRIAELANEISISKAINPLIVVIDKDDVYILEGATRAEALYLSGAKSFPAKVVLDEGSFYRAIKQALSEGKPVNPEVLRDYPELTEHVTPASTTIPSELESLLQEARKYKSAEEFVNAQNQYVYHNSSQRFLDSIKEEGIVRPDLREGYDPESFYTHGNKDISDNKPRIYVSEDPKRALSFGGMEKSEDYEDRSLLMRIKKSALGGNVYKSGLEGGEIWYFGERIKPENIEVLQDRKWQSLTNKRSTLPTKSQLTDIWNQANMKTPDSKGCPFCQGGKDNE